MINPTVKRRIKKILLWTEILLLLILAAGMSAVLGAFYQMNKLLPPDEAIDAYRAPVGTTIVSSDGVVLAKLAAENRDPVKLEKVPQHMKDAVVAIEDSRFYKHSGLDYRGLARALWANVTGRELAQGGSTLTQQLARNMFLSSRKTISRKMKEILMAVRIEKNWSKKRILEAYLNQVYFGGGAYGVKSASQVYFGKRVEDLTLPEAAMLAGLPQRPSSLSPYIVFKEEGNYDRTKARRDMVLDRMAELKFITPDEARKAKETPIKVAKERPSTLGYFKAKYFVDYAIEELRNELNYDQDLIEKGGLKVVTTLNWKMQQAAEEAARRGRDRWRRARVSEVALVCLDPHTGYIRSMVGGVNEPWEKYQFNVAAHGMRQPGSSFKTFVYAAAFEEGYSPTSGVQAAVKPIKLPDGKVYSPKNHGRSSGSMSYITAFANSVNGAAVNLAVQVGLKRVVDMGQRLGLGEHLRPYPSLALGVFEATPLQMARAYGVFPAKGKLAKPMAVLQVQGMEGEILDDIRPQIEDVGLKPQTITFMNILTRSVVTSGTGRAASIVPKAHGKTGTSENYTDAWFVGYTPDLVTAVWAGNRNNSPMAHIYGGTISAPIWANFMKDAVKLNPGVKKRPMVVAKGQSAGPQRTFAAAPVTADGNDRNRIRVKICTESGYRARRACKSTEMMEFILGQQPPMRCNVHGVPKRRPATEGGRARNRNGERGRERPAEGGGELPGPQPPAPDTAPPAEDKPATAAG